MTEHSLLGASSAARWLACPGSFKLSQIAPHRPSSIYAATGTLAHEMIEQAFRNGSFQCDESDIGGTLTRDGHDIQVDQLLVNGVNAMLRYLADEAPLPWLRVEFRVDLDDYFPTPPPTPVFGTVDATFLRDNGRVLEVVDYKNGAGVTVSVVENPQLLFYAAGVLADLPADIRDKVQQVRLTIVQPNTFTPVRSWEIDVLDLLLWVNGVLVPGVEACAQPNAPLNPGPWCRFCPVSHACPRLMQDAVAMAKREFDDGEPPQEPDELARALDAAERAELWIERIREFAVNQLEHQVRIPGWGLVPTRPTRKWTLPEDDVVKRLVSAGADPGEIWETQVRSPAQMEKALTRTRKGRALWVKTAHGMVEARSSGVKLGRDHHATAAEDFADE